MTVTYENFQNLESEEKNQENGKGGRKGGTRSPKHPLTPPPPQFLLCSVLSWTHLLLFSLALSLLLLLVVSVIGSQNYQLRRDLGALRATLANTTSSTKAEVQTLTSRGDRLQENISSMNRELEDHRQELLAGRSLSQKVASLEITVGKKEQALKTDLSEISERVQQLGKDLNVLTCQLDRLRNNGSESYCCPRHWTEHEGSCYWFSQSEKSWPEADRACQLENSHLVVVNSLEEQKFIEDLKGPVHSWMGLTDQNGPWRWVDGTDFDTGFKNWKPQQPDNWHGHGLGGGEDCAHFSYDDGRWNDDVCQRLYRWICEMELGGGS